MKPTLYLAGACENLPDLGIAWRREVAAAMAEVGLVPVWPAGLDGVVDGTTTVAEARAWFEGHKREVLGADIERMLRCSGVFLHVPDAGKGTRAEVAVALAADVPVFVHAAIPPNWALATRRTSAAGWSGDLHCVLEIAAEELALAAEKAAR